jgi:hypothetical protein
MLPTNTRLRKKLMEPKLNDLFSFVFSFASKLSVKAVKQKARPLEAGDAIETS